MAKPPKTDIDADLVRKLANLLDETGLTEIEYGDRYDPFQSTGQPDRAFEEIDVN